MLYVCVSDVKLHRGPVTFRPNSRVGAATSVKSEEVKEGERRETLLPPICSSFHCFVTEDGGVCLERRTAHIFHFSYKVT